MPMDIDRNEVRRRVKGGAALVEVLPQEEYAEEHAVILGQLTEQVLKSDAGGSVEDAMTAGPSTYRPNVSIQELWKRLEKHPRVQHVLVSTSDGVLLGVLWRSDLEEVAKGEH